LIARAALMALHSSRATTARKFDPRRVHDAGVLHPRDAEVVHVLEGAGDLPRDVEPADRLADDGEVLRVLGGRLGIELQIELLAADELPVADSLAAGLGHDPALRNRERFLVGGELGRRLGNESLSRRGRGLADLHAAVLDGEAAEGDALVGSERGIALYDGDVGERNRQLLRRDLGHRGADAGAEIDLAGEDRDLALGIDGEEPVHLVGRDGLLRSGRLFLGRAFRQPGREREADDQCSARLQQGTPAEGIVHGGPHVFAPAARFTARTMRRCVPQRQRLSARAALISASVGFFLCERRAAASMIMPLMQ